MTDEEFEKLKSDIVEAQEKLNALQGEYRKQTGVNYYWFNIG
jgi:hypothetical protein